MTESSSPVTVAALYHFAVVDDPAALRLQVLPLCEAHDLKGTILLAPEGINGTIAGMPDAIDRVIAGLRALPRFAGLEVKYSEASAMPFLRSIAEPRAVIIRIFTCARSGSMRMP